jgi:Tol biopolymer transport system component
LVTWKSGAAATPTDFRISHDGKKVAYSSSRVGGSEAIYIKQTSGGEDIQVTKDHWTNKSPLWSPNDEQIAYVSVREGQPGIYMSQAFGGVVTPLAILKGDNVELRHWARDGNAIFFEQEGNLHRLDLSTREIKKVTQLPDSPNTRYFSFSLDENLLAYCDVVDEQTDLWASPIAGGEPTRLTNDTDVESRLRWHPDGERILYNVWRNGFEQVNVVASSSTQPPVQVTRGEGNYELIDISPLGDKFYYSSIERKSDISSLDVVSGRENEIAAEPELEYWSAVSPDGTSLVYQSSYAKAPAKMYEAAFTLVSSDGQRRPLASRGFDARWLPDSRRLAILRMGARSPREYDVWVVDTVTGEERRITNEDVTTQQFTPMPISRADVSVVDFSPDVKRFIYVDRRQPQNAKIGSLDAVASTNLTTNQNPNLTYSSPIFSRDGTRIALVSLEEFADENQEPVRRLHVFDSTGGAGRPIFSTKETARMIGWSFYGDVILATTPQRPPTSPTTVDIVTVSPTGNSRNFFSLHDTYFRSLAISADGKTLAFVTNRNGRDDIWTVASNPGAEPVQITFSGNSRVFFANLVFSPDGRTIYFDKQEEVNTISMFENF